VQEQANFWGCKGFLPKKLSCNIFRPFFGVTSKKWSSLVFIKTLGAIFEVKQRWAPFLPRFSGIFPGFSTNQNFWGYAVPLSHPTATPLNKKNSNVALTRQLT